MTAVGTVSSVLACIYAIKAYESSKTPTFPLDNAYIDSTEISSLSRNAHDFEDFISSNVSRVVYLNVYFDEDSVDVDEEPELSQEEFDSYDDETKEAILEDEKTFYREKVFIWTECFEGTDRKQRPSYENHCTGLEISFLKNPDADAHLNWSRGTYSLNGYFSIAHYSGPYQGSRIASLRGERTR